MPYLRLLERLLHAVAGSQAALLLDVQGEVVVEAGVRDDRHRLIAAYQGIGLAMLQRTASRQAVGRISFLAFRYTWGGVLLRPLKDGYYLVISLSPDASIAQAVRHSAVAAEDINAEL